MDFSLTKVFKSRQDKEEIEKSRYPLKEVSEEYDVLRDQKIITVKTINPTTGEVQTEVERVSAHTHSHDFSPGGIVPITTKLSSIHMLPPTKESDEVLNLKEENEKLKNRIANLEDELQDKESWKQEASNTPHGKLVQQGKLIEAAALVEKVSKIRELRIQSAYDKERELNSIELSWHLEDGSVVQDYGAEYEPKVLHYGRIDVVKFDGEGSQGSLLAYVRFPTNEGESC